MIKKVLIISICILFFSCNNDKKEKLSLYELKNKGNISYILDEKSSFNIKSAEIQYIDKDEMFSFLNLNDNSIIYYKDNKQEKIVFEIEGQNGIGRLDFFSSHTFLGKDKILIIQSQQGKAFLINTKGKVIDKFDLIDIKNKSSLTVFPYSNTLNPILVNGNNIYTRCHPVGYFDDKSKIKSFMSLDIKTKKVLFTGQSLDRYYNSFWGALYKYTPSITFDDKQDILLNFPISEEIFKIKNNNLESVFLAKSKFINNKAKPFNENPIYGNEKSADWNRINNYSASNSDYAALLHDKYKNLFYRIVYLRNSIEDVKLGKRVPNFSIIVLDNNYKILLEKKFKSDIYSPELILISKKGIMIARKDLYYLDNDNLVFDIFNVEI